MKIKKIDDNASKQEITKNILEALPKWFGLEDSRQNYIDESIHNTVFASDINNTIVGFISLLPTSKDTLEIAVMGVLEEYHNQGIGRQLFETAVLFAKKANYSFLQVKTVEMGKYIEYDNTNKFYLSLGFKELEVFKNLWDEWNPCQIYIKSIK